MAKDTSNKAADTKGNAEANGPVFNVLNIYVKDLSFESPSSPDVFNAAWEPKVDFDLQLNSQVLSEAEHIHEVVLHLTVTVKLKDDKTAFLVDVKQAGIFTLKGFKDDVLKQVLGITCPTVIFPYARETVSNLVQRGGFPQLIIPTLNFEAMYTQQQQQGKNPSDKT
jgi:preprotein translocase subunit SecB